MPTKIAYIISAYKYPEQVIRLVKRLQTANTSFFLHIDKKSPGPVYRHIAAGLGGYANVYFLKRHNCYWGGFGHVRATLKGINALLSSEIEFDYVFLLTGQDYPIKSNQEIEEFLERSNGKSFIHYVSLPDESWPGTAGRLDKWHIHLFGRHIVLPVETLNLRSLFSLQSSPLWFLISKCLLAPRRFPLNFQSYGGGSYWCLSKACVKYIADFIKGNRAFINFFKYTYVPDEHFFQTIVLNSPYRAQLVSDDLRFIDWSGNKPNPDILTLKHLDAMKSSHKLFARKFDMTIDSDVLDAIDSLLLNRGKGASF